MTDHSLDNASYAKLTPDLVLDAIESVGYLSDARIFALNSYENRVYQIGIEDADPIIAKFYRPGRWSDEAILEEHEFAHQLDELEIGAVPPLKDKFGKTLHSYAGFRFALFKRFGGHTPPFDNFDCLEQLGRFLGRLHQMGSSKAFQHRPSLDVDSFASDSYHFLMKSNFIPMELEKSYQSLMEDILPLLKNAFSQHSSIKSIRTHGDFHSGNILWRDNSAHFVDLDDARMAPAVQDIWMMLSGDKAEQETQLSCCLDGYNQFYEFNPAELSLIEPLRTLRIIHYAGWLAKRWDDPAFPKNFPWFDGGRYWSDHILELREQFSLIQEAPIRWL